MNINIDTQAVTVGIYLLVGFGLGWTVKAVHDYGEYFEHWKTGYHEGIADARVHKRKVRR